MERKIEAMSVITIELLSEQYEALLEIANQEKKSEKQICLDAVHEYLKQKENWLKEERLYSDLLRDQGWYQSTLLKVMMNTFMGKIPYDSL